MNTQAAASYEFTNDWFSYNTPTWDLLLPRYNPRKFLEIGSYEGRATCYLIEKFGALGSVEIHCIDSWQGGIEHDRATMSAVEQRFDKNVAFAKSKVPFPAIVTKHKKFSDRALGELIASGQQKSFDIVYVDGSHQAPDVLIDCVMSYQLLKVGGLMIFDDYLWSMEALGQQDPLNMPKPAIDAFLNIFQRKMLIVRGCPVYQLYAVKTGE